MENQQYRIHRQKMIQMQHLGAGGPQSAWRVGGRDWVGDACGDDELKKTVDFAGFRERLRPAPFFRQLDRLE